jgi:hypothetical protein
LNSRATISPDGQIALPPEIASEIGTGEQIRIVVMWDPADSGVGCIGEGGDRANC